MNKFLLMLCLSILFLTTLSVTSGPEVTAASTVTIGLTGMYENLTEAMPYLSDGDIVIFVSDVFENPGVVVDKNITILGTGFRWIFNSTTAVDGLSIIDTSVHATNVTIMDVNILANNTLDTMIFTNASLLRIYNTSSDLLFISSVYRYNTFLAMNYSSSNGTVLLESVNISNPYDDGFELFVNGDSLLGLYMNNVNFSYQYGLYTYIYPNFLSGNIYDDSTVAVVANNLYVDPVGDGFHIDTYNSSWLSLSVIDFWFDWVIYDAFDLYLNGSGALIYSNNGYFWCDEAYDISDYAVGTTYLYMENLYVDYCDWDFMDIYTDTPGATIITAENLYIDYVGDEVFYVYAQGNSLVQMFYRDIVIDFADEESIYFDGSSDVDYVHMSVSNFTVWETDDDDTVYVDYTGAAGIFEFNNVYIDNNEEDDAFDLNDGSSNSNWILNNVYVGSDIEDDALDFSMWGPGYTYFLMNNSEMHESVWFGQSHRTIYNVTLYHDLIFGHFSVSNIVNMSIIETLFYEQYAYIYNSDVYVRWTLGVKIISTLTGLPAGGVNVLVFDGSNLLNSSVTHVNGLALITLEYSINQSYRVVPNMVIRTKVGNYIEDFNYGFPYTMPSFYDYYYIRIPVLVAHINGVSSAGLFKLDLRGRNGVITVISVADPINNNHRVVRYQIKINRVYVGLDIYVVDVLIRYRVGDRYQWYPGQMIFDFNTNIIILNGPISYMVKI